jgi:hypothetical protein
MKGDAVRETIVRSQRAGYAGIWNRWMRPPGPVAASSEHVAALSVWLAGEDTREVNGREFFIAGVEIGVLPEPELQRVSFNPDGWTLESLEDPMTREYLIGDIRNRFSRSGDPA